MSGRAQATTQFENAHVYEECKFLCFNDEYCLHECDHDDHNAIHSEEDDYITAVNDCRDAHHDCNHQCEHVHELE